MAGWPSNNSQLALAYCTESDKKLPNKKKKKTVGVKHLTNSQVTRKGNLL